MKTIDQTGKGVIIKKYASTGYSLPKSTDKMNEKEKKHFGERFKKWRQTKGVSAYRIAKLTGVNPSFISNIEANRRPMSEAFMRKLAAIPELDISFELLQAWKIQSKYARQELHTAYNHTVIEEIKRKTAAAPVQFTPLDGLYRIPLKMTVNAGLLQAKDELQEPVYVDWYGLQTLSTDLFCISVKGDSMWPPVPNGAILLVREVETLKSGERYVIETEDEQMTFKLVCFDKNGASLVPLNQDYAPIPLGEARLKRFYQVLAYKVDWS